MLLAPSPSVVLDRYPETLSQQILRRVCVRPPYFALQGIRAGRGALEARVSAETATGFEAGPMSAGELSRHAAIAGLCAAALEQDDDDRRYYLAREAEYEAHANGAPFGSAVELRAEVLELGKREARARISAMAAGAPLAELRVRYTILTDHAFERLFRARRQPNPARLAMGGLPPAATMLEGETWVRTFGCVPVAACAGHFEHHPAMPVAVLMGELADLAGTALARAGARYRVACGTVVAQDFVWAGEGARFEATPAGGAGDRLSFECAALAGDRERAGMRLTLERVPHG